MKGIFLAAGMTVLLLFVYLIIVLSIHGEWTKFESRVGLIGFIILLISGGYLKVQKIIKKK